MRGGVGLLLYPRVNREFQMTNDTAGERTATEVMMATQPTIGEMIVKEAAFLLNRLNAFYVEIESDELAREWDGHVAPSISRLEGLLGWNQELPAPAAPLTSDAGSTLADETK
jgi:hypothetical protein